MSSASSGSRGHGWPGRFGTYNKRMREWHVAEQAVSASASNSSDQDPQSSWKAEASQSTHWLHVSLEETHVRFFEASQAIETHWLPRCPRHVWPQTSSAAAVRFTSQK
eukprot:CAMPEP_0115759454 /NCGR_PEP_ID=MMETSP0272-20121206/99480_1 /TAXON_ID=71861 /ORGANISM="Scrippsiella trochoidea, Strain CCMP3099" /LENGTH=107 /DNA_ID=CAMNT_0003205065 /DNA_START=171 /DNA_END=494 /DNA_ORIENTATION=-